MKLSRIIWILLIFGCENPAVEEVVSEGPCMIAFNWYQKDSFQDYPKRIAKFWPPHTTTELDIQCEGNNGFKSIHAQTNHGTGPDKIVHGIQVLQKIKSTRFRSSEADAKKLDQMYRVCECQGAYFSMEELNKESRELFSVLSDRTKERFNCKDKSMVVADLKSGKISPDLLLKCGIGTNHDWEAAFGDAMNHLSNPLDSYHVCNNDAQLQAEMIRHFVDQGTVIACNDMKSSACSGPKIFYKP